MVSRTSGCTSLADVDGNALYNATGASDYADTGGSVVAGLTSYTIFVVNKGTATQSSGAGFVAERVGTGNPLPGSIIPSTTGTGLRALIRDTGGNSVDFSSASGLLTTARRSMALAADLTASGSTSTLYLDGASVATGTRPATWLGTAGASSFATRLNGNGAATYRTYVIYVFSSVLSAGDIAALNAAPYDLVRPVVRRSHVGVVSAAPSSVPFSPLSINVLAAWQIPAGLPTLPPLLSPQITAVRVDNPPFGTAAAFLAASTAIAWTPGPPQPQQLPTRQIVSVDNPPGIQSALSASIRSAWDIPAPTPTLNRFVPQVAAVATQQSPFSQAWLTTVLTAWQPAQLLPTLGGKGIPQGVRVDSPPPMTLGGWIAARYAWEPPPPQPTLLRNLPAQITAVRVDAPPVVTVGAWIPSRFAWEPLPPLPTLPRLGVVTPGPVIVLRFVPRPIWIS